MLNKLNLYSYEYGSNKEADSEFDEASVFGKVKMGQRYIFWKRGLRWSFVEIAKVQRAYRRIEAVKSKMCCGNVNFDIQKLVLLLKDGACLELLIGEGTPKEAEALYRKLSSENPQIQYGKPINGTEEIR